MIKDHKLGFKVILIVTILGIIFLEVMAFVFNPNRPLWELIRDIFMMIIGFLTGNLIRRIGRYILPSYKLNILFGFLFLGIGVVLTSVFRYGSALLSYEETYYGLVMIILCISGLIIMHKSSILNELTDFGTKVEATYAAH